MKTIIILLSLLFAAVNPQPKLGKKGPVQEFADAVTAPQCAAHEISYGQLLSCGAQVLDVVKMEVRAALVAVDEKDGYLLIGMETEPGFVSLYREKGKFLLPDGFRGKGRMVAKVWPCNIKKLAPTLDKVAELIKARERARIEIEGVLMFWPEGLLDGRDLSDTSQCLQDLRKMNPAGEGSGMILVYPVQAIRVLEQDAPAPHPPKAL